MAGKEPFDPPTGRWDRRKGEARGKEGLRAEPHTSSIPNRAPEKETISRAMLPLTRRQGHLWAYSSEPLRQPLLKRVHDKADLRDIACLIFLDILSQPACPHHMHSTRHFPSQPHS